MISNAKDKRLLGYGLLNSYSNISHFVTTRRGGCSKGKYESFNCSPHTEDASKNVWLNQSLLLEGIKHPVKDLIVPQQVHSNVSLLIDDRYFTLPLAMRRMALNGIDALITAEPGCCICVSTADCVPVLLYDRKLQVVAAVHAGWKGTVKRIVSHVLKRMNEEFGTRGEDVIACIGPSISLESFEVGEEVFEVFRTEGFEMARISLWKEETGKHHIDLWEANRMQLLDFGVSATQIELSGICTYKNHDDFFSARRLGIDSGRILSGIMINS